MRLRRAAWFGLMFLLALGLAAAAQEVAAPPQPTFRLAAWNLEWLGSPDKRAEQPDPELIAKYLIMSRPDVLVLEEITQNIITDQGWGNAALEEALRIVSERTGGNWKHLLFFKENHQEKEQLVGVAWNAAKVSRVGEPYRIPVRRRPNVGEQWHRHPWGMKFSLGVGKTDFVVVPLHMKSNRGGYAQTSKQRAEEARSLVRALGALQNAFSDDDIVLAGDTNILKPDEPALARFLGAGFFDLNGGKHLTWIQQGEFQAAPFDRFFVPDDQPEFSGIKMQVMRDNPLGDEKLFRDRLSDHYMIATDVKIMADDD